MHCCFPPIRQGGGGSGLGLCITKSLIEQHGGSIVVDSPGPGLGATVTVELPLYRFPEAKRSASTQTVSTSADTIRLAQTGSFPSSPKTSHVVLVVDDSLSNRKMLVRLLERSGHKCISACNGQEAITMFTADKEASLLDPTHTPIDTILMDYEMPVMNGPEATRILRDNGCVAWIIGVTGNVLTEDIAFFKKMGADDVLPKPVQLTLLDEYWENA
jgi:two-component system, sensor histidine kinase